MAVFYHSHWRVWWFLTFLPDCSLSGALSALKRKPFVPLWSYSPTQYHSHMSPLCRGRVQESLHGRWAMESN
jgi:hypothetical protein